ncbi:MAG: hypothetical protein ACFFE8_06915, partial [Candidatus Heimdallarchaeota archaeon]
MSERQREIEAKVIAHEKEKKILEGVKAYYEKKNLSFSDIEEISGISIREFKRYQQEHDYPYRASLTHLKAKRLSEKIDQRVAEIDKAITNLRGSIFGTLNQLIFIPNWQRLIGTSFTGFYRNQPVQKIFQATVAFLPDVALAGFEETMGEPFFLLTGLGIYYVKFQMGAGSIVTDHREITGIVLPLDVYERAQDESGSLLESTVLRMTEYITAIPFSLVTAKRTTQMYLRGVLSRNVFMPNKECFDQLMASCQNPNSFSPEEGFKILSGGLSTQRQLYTNEILTERPLGDYSSLIAGIKNTQPKLDKIIADLQLNATRDAFFAKLQQIKSEFYEIGRKVL